MRTALIIGSTLILATHAQASVADYCAAYARDFADKVQKQDVQWQHRYDNAEKSCLLRFTNNAQHVIKIMTKKPIIKKPAPPIVTEAQEKQPEPARKQANQVAPKLEAGSPEWTDYCKKKYVSFNETKGTYLSKTGVERKCLVTAD